MELKRENVLIEALPYMQEFYDSIMVIKVGGNAMVSAQIMEDIIKDIVLLRYVGIKPVIVHGGGPEITEKKWRGWARKLSFARAYVLQMTRQWKLPGWYLSETSIPKLYLLLVFAGGKVLDLPDTMEE